MSFSILCQLNNGCMGCCGNHFVKEKMKDSIHLNTKEFEEVNPKLRQEFIQFRDRRDSYDLRNGVCRNLIEEKGRFVCPLHPSRHPKGQEDLRLGHCDVFHLCNTAKEFATWHKKKQEEFITFIESKGLNNIEYSLSMNAGKLLKEFKEK
ncbi:hypothetical protein HYT52_03250 [Candidatus Woesearchaeota archaeon]|nr:hypothetical protein [Candidatus Woesearchaeota archaeon]